MGKILDITFAIDAAVSGGGFKNMQLLQNQMSKLQSTGEKLQAKTAQISAYQNLSETLKTSSSRLQYLRASYQSADSALGRSRERTASLGEQYEQAKQRVKDWSAAMPKNSMFLQTAIRSEQELSRAYRESQKETQRLEQERNKLYRQVGEGSSRLEREQRALEEMSQAMRDAGLSTQNLEHQQLHISQSY